MSSFPRDIGKRLVWLFSRALGMSAQSVSRVWHWFGSRNSDAQAPGPQSRRRIAPAAPTRPIAIVPARREAVGEPLVACPRLMPASSWAYQLQHIDIATIAASPADVAVIDTSPDGDWHSAFTAQQVALMKTRPDGRPDKKLIAYMSIGEAEEQRFYWQPEWVRNGRKTERAPKWLHALNDQGWTGNWKVRFWEPGWQANIIGANGCFVDRIIDQGFDGVYLDIIDAYDYWLQPERGAGRRPSAAEEMVAFVRRIGEHARVTRGRADFAVIPQNGEGLLVFPQYRACIAAIGKEDILYDQFGKADAKPRVRPRPEHGGDAGEGIEEIMSHLRLALADRIPVLSVEYLRDWPEDQTRIEPALARMRANGLIPHFGRRDLGSLSETTVPLPATIPTS